MFALLLDSFCKLSLLNAMQESCTAEWDAYVLAHASVTLMQMVEHTSDEQTI